MSVDLTDHPPCRCVKCQSACSYKPGWMAPEDVAPLANLLNLSEDELFTRFLAVDWWEDGDDTLFVLSPAVVENDPGQEFPYEPRGTCVFFNATTGSCEVHLAKPLECRVAGCGEKNNSLSRHHAVAETWRGHQDIVSRLLGRHPLAS